MESSSLGFFSSKLIGPLYEFEITISATYRDEKIVKIFGICRKFMRLHLNNISFAQNNKDLLKIE
jgi:hypothetical protein